MLSGLRVACVVTYAHTARASFVGKTPQCVWQVNQGHTGNEAGGWHHQSLSGATSASNASRGMPLVQHCQRGAARLDDLSKGHDHFDHFHLTAHHWLKVGSSQEWQNVS